MPDSKHLDADVLVVGAGPTGLTVALDAMRQTAAEARQRAEANDMKAQALHGAKEAEADKNIAAALAEVRGDNTTKSLSDRLAALRR